MKTKNKKYPWVFWINIERRTWFKKFWKSRGANCLDIQIFNLRLSIGMPWITGELDSAIRANKTFTKWNHIHIKNII